MLCIMKKLRLESDQLLSLALILSLIRIDPESYLGLSWGRWNGYSTVLHNMSHNDIGDHIPVDFFRSIMGNVPETTYFHPKSMEASLARYQEELLEDLSNLGHYSNQAPAENYRTITAYLFDERNDPHISSIDSVQPSVSSVVSRGQLNVSSSVAATIEHQPINQLLQQELLEETSNGSSETGLSSEDADLIEILWKQDIDLGIPRDLFLSPNQQVHDNSNGLDVSTSIQTKEKLSTNGTITDIECEKNSKDEDFSNKTEVPDEDPWAGLAYTIDDETGEYILQDPAEAASAPACESEGLPSDVRVEEDPYLLEKALNFIKFNSDDFDEDKLTESNFTLGALSPDPDAKPIRGEDLLLGSIAAPPQPTVRTTVESVAENQLEDSSLYDSDSLTGFDLDLGFYLSEESSSQITKNTTESLSSNDIESIENQSEELEASLEDMIQAAQMHPRSLQVRMPLMRTMSMDHRWQDLANLLSLPDGTNLTHHSHTHGHHPLSHPLPSHSHPFAHPYPHAHHTPIHNPHAYGVHSASTAVSHHYGGLTPPGSVAPAYPSADAGRSVLLQNAPVPSTLTELHGVNGSYPSPNLGSAVSLGSAVTASMNLTNSTEPLEAAGQSAYKVESAPDMQLYYQGNTTEVNQTGDGFFPSIFNDDDLQLMDMAMTDTMYPTRMLDNQSVSHGIAVPTAANPSSAAPVPNTVLDTASDSAVSSMGSERVPSISDSDWIDPNPSDSNVTSTGSASAAASSSGYSMDYASSKYRGYEYGYGGRQGAGVGVGGGTPADSASARGVSAPVAQKKHHMFGKRAFHDQNDLPGAPAVQPSIPNHKYDYSSSGAAGSLYTLPPTQLDNSTGLHSMDLKYGCSMDYNHHPHDARGVDHIHHNHSYALGSEASITSQRPLSRDKHRASSSGLRGSISDTSIGASTSGSGSESEAYSRDEKRARAMNIPMSIDDIINLPMDEFNERLSKYDLTEAQLSLIRDIRRRGKNKVAAQNCRKRKLDQILSLADEVKRVRERKIRLTKEREYLLAEKVRLKDRFAILYRHVFQSLRDPDGQPYSPYEYSLQQSADGNILLVPRGAPQGSAPIDPQPSRPLMEPSGMTNVSGIHHGTRRKATDEKNEP